MSGGLDFSIFSRGEGNPLVINEIRDGLSLWPELFLPALILAALLGYMSYTDLFAGRRIYNWANGLVALLTIGLSLWIFPDLKEHYLFVLASVVFIFVIYITGAIKEGDVKLYLALSFLFGKSIFLVIFISWIFIIVYSLPLMRKKLKQQKASGQWEKKGHRLGTPPGAPGIALAVPATLYLLGVATLPVAAFLAVEVLVVLIGISLIGSKQEILTRLATEYQEDSKLEQAQSQS